MAKGGGRPSQGASRARRPVHGVRERTGEYGAPEKPSEASEADRQALGSTRYLETAQGELSYTQVSERLAVALASILRDTLEAPPDSIAITPEWVRRCHRDLAGALFPSWAGRYRDVEVQVGTHRPPSFFEVPLLVRAFCDDLAERLRHVRPRDTGVDVMADLLSWADGRFQWIHPFRDFNGRVGRIILATLLYKLALRHVETAPTQAVARRHYLEGLRAVDQGDYGPLKAVWIRRIAMALER